MLNMRRPISSGNAGLVGLPVFLTAVFCFALVFSHSAGRNSDAHSVTSASGVSRKAAINASKKTAKKLPAKDQGATAPAKSGGGTEASQLHVGSVNSGGASSSHTGTPQQPSNAAKKLQDAGSSDESIIKSTVDKLEKTLKL